MQPAWKDQLSGDASQYVTDREQREAERFTVDVDALLAEARRRANCRVWVALEWVLFDWQSPGAYSRYEERVQSAVVDALRLQLSPTEREAFDSGASEAEYRLTVLAVANRHTSIARRLLEAA